jgi:hypothetical protein
MDVAIRELCDNAGTQFDPVLVPLFVELLMENLVHSPGVFSPHFTSGYSPRIESSIVTSS